MKRKTRRTEIRIETHEIKIIRFGRLVDEESNDTETVLVDEHVKCDLLDELRRASARGEVLMRDRL